MARGFSLIELLVAVSVLVIVCGMAIPSMTSAISHARAAGAARYIAGRLGESRMEAVRRSTFVAIRFHRRDGQYELSTVVDGNGNGVRAVDVTSGADVQDPHVDTLEQHFAGVTFGLHRNVEPVSRDEGSNPEDPIRIGRSEFLSFSPLGSATSGTLYIRGDPGHQFAVRILGATGRIGVIRYDFQDRQWVER